MKTILIRNIGSNWTGFLVHAVVAFFLTPFIIAHLGGKAYGIWLLITNMTGYYGLITLGLNAGTTQQLTRCFAEGDIRRLNAVASAASLALSLFGLVAMILSVAVAFLAPLLFDVEAAYVHDMRLSIIVTGISAAIQFALFPHAALFPATQRYDLANLIAITTRIFSAGCTLVALHHHGGLLSLCVIIAIFDCLGAGLQVLVARRLVPQLAISWRHASGRSFRDIGSVSFWNMVCACGERLMDSGGIFVIGALLSEEAIAPYGAAHSLAFYVRRLLGSAAIVFYPVATKLHAANNTAALTKMFLKGARGMILLALIIGITAANFAPDFFQLWLGDELLKWSDYPSVATLFQVMVVGIVLNASVLIGHQVLLGAHQLRVLCKLVATEVAVSITAMFVLVYKVGVWGSVWGALAGTVIVRVVLFPWAVGIVANANYRRFIQEGLLRPLAFAAVGLPFALWFKQYVGHVTSWPSFFMTSGLCAAGLTLMAAVIGLTQQELRHTWYDRCLRHPVEWGVSSSEFGYRGRSLAAARREPLWKLGNLPWQW